ncbi:uncharacterized protein [Anoplolepis gracilipes]|uniref:uncharacterized protein n=1 Tax=Anoplolepis gracilipes TaxID=354296 RepID=UPI003B9EF3B3
MYKLVALLAALACATAAPEPGYLAAPALHAAPVVAAPVAVAHAVPLATSYANTYKVSVKSPLVAAPIAPVVAAPVLKAAPVVAAAPVLTHAAPIAYAAHAPVLALH